MRPSLMGVVWELYNAFPIISATNLVNIISMWLTSDLPEDNIERIVAVFLYNGIRLLLLFPSALSTLFILAFVEFPRIVASIRMRRRHARLYALLAQMQLARAAEAAGAKTWRARVERMRGGHRTCIALN